MIAELAELVADEIKEHCFYSRCIKTRANNIGRPSLSFAMGRTSVSLRSDPGEFGEKIEFLAASVASTSGKTEPVDSRTITEPDAKAPTSLNCLSEM